MNPLGSPEPGKPSETEELSGTPGDGAEDEFPATVTDVRVDGAVEEAVDLEFGSPKERYEVLELLGEGGMGEVFEARDRLFGRRVALKFVKPTASRLIFFREARTSGLLTHPNIPPVYDIGIDPTGRPFYAMQLIRGRNLAEILKERRTHPDRWSLPRLLTLFQSLCSALGYAHERGLVHLDVKPGNVMVGELQQLYVVDWGLSASENEEVRETRGTPAYMSPEQASASRTLGSASDVFSAACVLYEIAARQRCFPGRTRSEVLERVRSGEFDRSERWLEVPMELRDLITAGLAADPSRRPSASMLNDQIQTYLDGTRERTRRREEAEEAIRRAEEALRDRERWVGRRNERLNLAASLRPPTWVSGEARQEFWSAEDAIEEAELQIEVQLQRATGHLLEAHRVAPREPELAVHLARLYWERFAEAESRRDRFLTEFYRGQLLALGRSEDARRLSAGGYISVHCEPTPTRLSLHRLVEDQRVLRPGEPIELPIGDRSEELAIGAYHMDVTADGFRETRMPVRVDRERTTTITLNLRADSEIGEGFVWIPAGRFVMGGDPATFESVPRAEVEVGDFCIAKYPVTWEEYQAYLQARLNEGEDIEEWIPKLENAHGRPWHIRDGEVRYAQASENAPVESRRRWPVFSVTHHDAVEYCRWLTEREGRVYDLPSDSEWEKAARGVDERIFPWGNRFDPSLCRNSGSVEGRAQPGLVGEYESDCSPYGVRDMAGGVREWCASWFNEKDEQRLVRGGSWNFGEIGAHCAYRLGCSPSLHFPFIGFRLVHRFETV